ncbi:cadherin-like protein 26 [Leuresthes tenuis]|uniref:cadherin-like protein 26 n=1 Tax=Leuresthes tenuis TaxID=355514 RepID=UPI003B50EE57
MLFFLLFYYLTTPTCSELLSRHRRSWIIESFEIEEGHPGPFPYALGKVNIDRKYQVYFELFGEGVDEEPKGVLSIQKDSGTLYVHRALDYEEKTMLKLRFEAKKTDSSTDTKLGIEISILDINDNPPRFERNLYEITVNEDNTQGSHLLTVLAHDRDQRGTPNSTFLYEIKSVSPNLPDTEFFIEKSGALSFRGCLDHEVAKMFTVLVEAKDQGKVVRLSSSTTVVIHVQDGNNHLPIISGQTGTGKVKENQSGFSPLRLHVTDKDTVNSRAWRARYTLHGDEGRHFKIETDPETNDGILTVVKPLDFEDGAQRELSISVENEMPYFSCKVKEKTSSGLWEVDTRKGHDPGGVGQPHSISVIIEVEDTNDPPEFRVIVKEVMLEENAPVGTWVEKVVAQDPDFSLTRDLVYKVGSDPAGWVTVDPHTGDITTIKTPDRESPHVVDGLYTILLHAVDDGEPPMTGTATLQVHVTDQNDNVPQLTADCVDVCASDGPTTANITAFDPDGNPFGGPFKFELLGNVDGKWKLNPRYGFTAGLVKEPGVYIGLHTIDLKISDMQGMYGIYNLSVAVCDCSATSNCHSGRETTTKVAHGAVGIVLASLSLFLLLLLMAVVISCKEEFTTLQIEESFRGILLASNSENPGTDCKVTTQKVPESVVAASADEKHYSPSNWQRYGTILQQQTFRRKKEKFYPPIQQQLESDIDFSSSQWPHPPGRLVRTVCLLSCFEEQAEDNSFSFLQFEDISTMNLFYEENLSYATGAALPSLLHEKLSFLKETEEDLLDYKPHLYEVEGNSDNLSELECITIPDEDNDSERFKRVLTDLGPHFKQLAEATKNTRGNM